MKTLSIDLETFSSVDIKEQGLHNYIASPDFEILLFGYSVDQGDPVVVDIACGESVPQEILQALFDASVKKTAWNAIFEISCLSKLFRLSCDQMCGWAEQWHDTMVQARYCALPGSLDAAGKALGLPEDKRKIATGKSLIRLFSCPRKPTAKDSRTRVMPADEPEKWRLYKQYNAGDVVTEMTIAKYLEPWPVPEDVRRQWLLDVRQNERGVPVDAELVSGALQILAETEQELNREAQNLTGLDNPNSREQLKAWIEQELGAELADLTKETVETLLKKDLPGHVRRVLEIRQELSKAAPKKFVAMQNNMCADGRLRGMMVFYGASRTGRWCIAEGSLVRVKTKEGVVLDKPIEKVLLSDMVWDGESWVSHEGVVCNGERPVIEWDGVVATPDHKVWVSPTEKVELSYAASRKLPIWCGTFRRCRHV